MVDHSELVLGGPPRGHSCGLMVFFGALDDYLHVWHCNREGCKTFVDIVVDHAKTAEVLCILCLLHQVFFDVETENA
jgi:hypothetical protein